MKLNENLFCNLYRLVRIRDGNFEEKIQHPFLSDSMIVGEDIKSVNVLIRRFAFTEKLQALTKHEIRFVCSMEMVVKEFHDASV